LSSARQTVKTSRVATFEGFGAILLWSSTVAVARSLSEKLGPSTGAAAVYTVGSATAVLALLRHRGLLRRIISHPPRYLFGCGLLFVGNMVATYLAIGLAAERQQVLEVGLINYLWPALTLVFSLALLKKKATWTLVPGTLLALGGIFLVLTQGTGISWDSFSNNVTSNPAAYALALTAAISWALYSNLTRRWAGEEEEGAVALFLPATAAAFILMACIFDKPREWDMRCVIEVSFLGLATHLGYVLWDKAMRRGNVVMVAAGSYLTPLFSTIVSCLYLSVVPGLQLWAGCGVLILGSFLSWRAVSDAPATAPVQPS
jgi:drug/metabolite transporter (DMT)-like permease